MAQVLFSRGLTPSDPVKIPVIILGQHQHLVRVAWEDIRAKLEPRVTQEMWTSGVSSLSPIYIVMLLRCASICIILLDGCYDDLGIG